MGSGRSNKQLFVYKIHHMLYFDTIFFYTISQLVLNNLQLLSTLSWILHYFFNGVSTKMLKAIADCSKAIEKWCILKVEFDFLVHNTEILNHRDFY